MKIDLIVDMQYGSTGKGLLAGYLAENNKYDGVVTCNMPNAGHTYISRTGNKMIHKVLPNGIVSPNLRYVFIGPGAVFSEERLMKEVEEAREMGYLKDAEVIIHPSAVVLQDYHRTLEEREFSKISSTMQGSAAALIEKMGRSTEECNLACKKFSNKRGVSVVDHTIWMGTINQCKNILGEGSQGFSLGLNQRFWPYCTSRECTPARMMSDMGLPQITPTVWGTLRTYPIRVGNTSDGYSGSTYWDQNELTWEELGQTPEKTTVTQRVRRVFTFSKAQLREALWHCRPNHIFLNFANYMDPHSLYELTNALEEIAHDYEAKVDLLGYGPAYEDVRTFHTG